MLQAETKIEGGFSEPVLQAQTVFRAVMNAMARPGTIETLDPFTDPPAGLAGTAASIACALVDADTPLWLDKALSKGASVRAWLAFQTGAGFVDEPNLARFAIAADPEHLPAFEAFAQGTQEYPDRSTTIVLQVETLTDGDGLVISGPGIRDRASIAPAPLPPQFCERWSANGSRFPRGIDLMLAAPGALACLPRTARIKPAGGA